MIKIEEIFSINSLHFPTLHSWIAITYMPTTAAKRPHVITRKKPNKIPIPRMEERRAWAVSPPCADVDA